ncbi:MAG TPA: glycosyltransferase family 4 protein [Usitatibacter sp.]|nr:glycosyltransferase family 4 protein [Usitatibacter sp.]
MTPNEASRPLRVALVAPLHESVPPQFYGGTERVVSYLAEELVRQGHRVTLYATGDSVTSAELRSMWPRGLRLDPECRDTLAPHIAMLHDVIESIDEFDVIHFHVDYLHFAAARLLRLPAVTTLHGRLDNVELAPLYRRYADMPVVSISDAQRRPLPWAKWAGTVHHGLPPDLLRAGPGDGGYLAFVGRISPEKRPDRAIRIARRAGLPLRIAAKVEKTDQPYFESVVKPLLGPGVEFVGEIGERDKQDFLGRARALLFPIDWPEPFGLVMIESLACATPVIAFPCGSVPEVLRDGVDGRIVASEDEAVEAVARIGAIGRAACRASFDARFTAERMARDYVAIYRALAAAGAHTPMEAAA